MYFSLKPSIKCKLIWSLVLAIEKYIMIIYYFLRSGEIWHNRLVYKELFTNVIFWSVHILDTEENLSFSKMHSKQSLDTLKDYIGDENVHINSASQFFALWYISFEI